MSAAVMHILRRMESDPRLAWLIGPGSQTFDLLIEEGAEIFGRTAADFRQRVEGRLQFEPWPTALQAEFDAETVVLAQPDWEPTHWYGSDNFYSSSGHILKRMSWGRNANLWEGFEARKAVHGHEAWTSAYRYYVPNDFGHLVEVPAR